MPGTADVVVTMQIVMERTGKSPDTLDRFDGRQVWIAVGKNSDGLARDLSMDKRFKMLADDDSSAFSVSELITLYVGKP